MMFAGNPNYEDAAIKISDEIKNYPRTSVYVELGFNYGDDLLEGENLSCIVFSFYGEEDSIGFRMENYGRKIKSVTEVKEGLYLVYADGSNHNYPFLVAEPVYNEGKKAAIVLPDSTCSIGFSNKAPLVGREYNVMALQFHPKYPQTYLMDPVHIESVEKVFRVAYNLFWIFAKVDDQNYKEFFVSVPIK